MDTTPRKTQATPKASPNPVSSAFSAIKAKRLQLDHLLTRYDVRKISPTEIDSFVEDMAKAGQPVNAEMLMLASFGKSFLDHLAQVTGQPYNASVQVDMIDVAKGQRDVAARAKSHTEDWDQFLRFLHVLEDRSDNFMTATPS